MIDRIKEEYRKNIRFLANMVVDSSSIREDRTPPASVTFAMHTSLVARDYVRMCTPKIENPSLHNFFSRDPGAFKDFTRAMTVGEIFQLIDCTGDIEMHSKTIGGSYTLHEAKLNKAVGNAVHSLVHFVSSNDTSTVCSSGNADTLYSIMKTTFTDIGSVASSAIKSILTNIATCPDPDRKLDLEGLGATYTQYLGRIGFSFQSAVWDEESFGKEKSKWDITCLYDWGSGECGAFFNRMVYLPWYNPINTTAYEWTCSFED